MATECDGFDCSIYVVDRRTVEEREEAERRYREERIAAGACPECLRIPSEVKAVYPAVNADGSLCEGETDAEALIRYIIDGLFAERPVGTCKTCGLTIWQPVM
jgi:hypothetical protein